MSKQESSSQKDSRTAAEWVSLIVSLVLLAVVVAVVIALWVGPPRRPANFRVERGPVRQEANRYYLPVTVTNEGDETGAQVMLEGKLKQASGEETATTTFDFIPASSSAVGTLIFDRDPAEAELLVVSYQEP